MKLTILIPAFNEEQTIYSILEQVTTAPLPQGIDREVIVVDDCSQDMTQVCVQNFMNQFDGASIKYIRHDVNQGKGAALTTGINAATGGWLVVQDAEGD